jgi:WD40 repeat protein
MSKHNMIHIPLIDTLSEKSEVEGTQIAIDPTGRFLAECCTDKASIWSLSDESTTWSKVSILDGHRDIVTTVAFHPSGILLATGSKDNNIKIWRMSLDGTKWTCVSTLRGHNGAVNSLVFHPTGQFLVSSGWDSSVKLWRMLHDETMWTCVSTLDEEDVEGPIISVAFNPNGSFLATGSFDDNIQLWQINDDCSLVTLVSTLDGHSSIVNSVAFHPSKPFLLTGSFDKTAKLWSMSSDGMVVNSVEILKGQIGMVYTVAFHPHGVFFATGSGDQISGNIMIWVRGKDNNSAICVSNLTTESRVVSIAFHPSGAFLASLSKDGSLKLWDCRLLTDKAQRIIALMTPTLKPEPRLSANGEIVQEGNLSDQLVDRIIGIPGNKDIRLRNLVQKAISGRTKAIIPSFLKQQKLSQANVHPPVSTDAHSAATTSFTDEDDHKELAAQEITRKGSLGGRHSRRKYKMSKNKYNRSSYKKM